MSMEHRGKGQKGRTTGIFCLEQVKQDTGSMPLAMKYTQLPSCHCHSLTLDLKEFPDPCPAPVSWLSEDGLLCASLYLFPLATRHGLTYSYYCWEGQWSWDHWLYLVLFKLHRRKRANLRLARQLSISQSAFVAHLTLCCPWQ